MNQLNAPQPVVATPEQAPRGSAHAAADDSRAQLYNARIVCFQREHDETSRRASRLAHLRLAAFLLGVILAVVGFAIDAQPASRFSFAATALAAVAFIALIVIHRGVQRNVERLGTLVEINRQAAARLARRWKELRQVRQLDAWVRTPLARDLDLFAPASLMQLLGTAHTPSGRMTLGRWLLEPASPNVARQRQQAVRALASQLEARQELERLALPLAEVNPNTEPFLEWAEGPLWLAQRKWLTWLARLVPATVFALALLQIAGVVQAAYWLLPGIVGLLLSFLFCSRVHEVFARVSRRSGEVARYVEILAAAGALRGDADELVRLHAALQNDEEPAERLLDRLARLMALADLRFSPMIYLPVQALLLWDFHVLGLVERWQARHGRKAREWFAALGELEALAALAALAHDQPDWKYPEFTPDEPQVVAKKLGHPLLANEQRVSNDVQVGPPGTFLLVTGSNMSGKSTLLRAVGLNVILASAGGPVCAERFSLPALRIATSVRIEDSLEDGVSLFMAELARLKQIVDTARQLEGDPDWRLLFLLDEILHGTNTAERQVAVRQVVEHLVHHGAIGAITTHDLELARTPALSDAARAVHFRESFTADETGREQMTFDYQLREGVATTTNALRLLAIVGLTDKPGPDD